MSSNAVAAAVALLLIGCETDRYQWNLQHCYVTPQAHLAPGDFESIIRLVTHATPEQVLQISQSPKDTPNKRRVDVMVGGSGSTHQVAVEKTNGSWHIVYISDVVE